MTGFRSRTVTLSGRVSSSGGVERVFPLFSPPGEELWVPGWKPEYLHPAEPGWSEGQIFRTREASGEAVWVVTRLDRERHRAEYHRVEPGHYVARVRVDCRPAAGGGTATTIAYTYFGLSEAGNAEIAAMTREAYEAKMVRWAGWIERYLATADGEAP